MFSQGKDGYCFGILVSLLYFDQLVLIVFGYYSIDHLFCIFTTIIMRCHTTGVRLHFTSTTSIWWWEGEFPTCQKVLTNKKYITSTTCTNARFTTRNRSKVLVLRRGRGGSYVTPCVMIYKRKISSVLII